MAILGLARAQVLRRGAGILKDLDTDITGRAPLRHRRGHRRTQLTLSWLVKQPSSRARLAGGVALRKPGSAPDARGRGLTGFDARDEFVVGYSLDYAQRYRNLPFIGAGLGSTRAARLAPQKQRGTQSARRSVRPQGAAHAGGAVVVYGRSWHRTRAARTEMAIPPEVDGTVRLVRRGDGPEPTGRSSMELRRFFRAPLLLIAVAVCSITFRARLRQFEFTTPWRQTPRRSSASSTASRVQSAIITDKNQTIQITTKKPVQIGPRTVRSSRLRGSPVRACSSRTTCEIRSARAPCGRVHRRHPQEQRPARPAAHRVHLPGGAPPCSSMPLLANARQQLAGRKLAGRAS